MAEKSGDDQREPSLELPSLFGRRRKRAAARAEPEARPVEPAAPPAERVEQPDPVEAAQPVERAEPVEAAPLDAPVVEELPAPVPEPEPEVTRPLDVGEQPEAAPSSTTEGAPTDQAAPSGARRAEPRPRRMPALPTRVAAILTGLVVGLAGTGLTYAGLQGCEALRGTDSCGGPGLLLLVAILAVMVLLGGVLLTALRVPDAQSTSFLAVGVTAVVVMVALLEAVFSPWMFLAVPLISMASYALAQWVTTRFVDQPERGPGIDVR